MWLQFTNTNGCFERAYDTFLLKHGRLQVALKDKLVDPDVQHIMGWLIIK